MRSHVMLPRLLAADVSAYSTFHARKVLVCYDLINYQADRVAWIFCCARPLTWSQVRDQSILLIVHIACAYYGGEEQRT